MIDKTLKELVFLLTFGDVKCNRDTLNQADILYQSDELCMWYLSTGPTLTEQYMDLESFVLQVGVNWWFKHGDNLYYNFEPVQLSQVADDKDCNYITNYVEGLPRVTSFIAHRYYNLLYKLWSTHNE